MQPAYEIPHITATDQTPSELDADLLAVPLGQDQRPGAAWLDEATAGGLGSAFERGEFTGKPYELWTGDAAAWRTRRVLAVGVGASGSITPEIARRAGTAAGLTARQQKRRRIGLVVNPAWSGALIESLVEGVVLANFDGGHYKSRPDGQVFLSAVMLAGAAVDEAGAAIQRGVRVGEAVNAARLLINEPGNRLTPTDLAARGQALLSLPHVTVDVLDQK